jgi:hypothetical protein
MAEADDLNKSCTTRDDGDPRLLIDGMAELQPLETDRLIWKCLSHGHSLATLSVNVSNHMA